MTKTPVGQAAPTAAGSPTKRVGLVGWPVEHSVSPAMHNAAFQALGLDWLYTLLPTPPERIGAVLERMQAEGYRGANVTTPHKQTVMSLLDENTDAAQAIGAVNTIVKRQSRWVGYNTDGHGFLAALEEAHFKPFGRRALVLGAGGAARAVVYTLAEAGCAVTIYNRTVQHAATLAHQMQRLGSKAPITWVPVAAVHDDDSTEQSRRRLAKILDPTDFDLLVNATPVGTWPQNHASPWPETLPLPSHWTVIDLVYNPVDTQLLAQARAAGATAVGGVVMLVHQGAKAFELWTDRPAPIEVMHTAAKRALQR